MDVIYRISRWKGVFEKSDAKKIADGKPLAWISCPTSFNSNGYQNLLETFEGMEAAALYGAWLALCQIAATSPIRGQLSGQQGQPYTMSRLSRLSGLPESLFSKLIPWAVSIGWIVTGDASGESPKVPGESPDYGTEQDITKQDGTERNGSRCRAVPKVENHETHETQETQPGVAAAATESHEPVNGPASVKLGDLASMPLLARLDSIQVNPSGRQILGSVFSSDRIKAEHIDRAETDFFVDWYRDQLSSRSPVLRCGNAAELVYCLAAVFAAKRCKVKSKVALWVKWIKSKEAGSITKADWRMAAERIERHLGIDSDPKAPNGAAPNALPSASPVSATPAAERSKRPKMTRSQLAARAAELRAMEAEAK